VKIGYGCEGPGMLGTCHVNVPSIHNMTGQSIPGDLAGIAAQFVMHLWLPKWETVEADWNPECPDTVEARTAALAHYQFNKSTVDFFTKLPLMTTDEREAIEVRRILENAFLPAHKLVLEKWDFIEAVANALLKKRTLTGKQFDKIIERIYKKRRKTA